MTNKEQMLEVLKSDDEWGKRPTGWEKCIALIASSRRGGNVIDVKDECALQAEMDEVLGTSVLSDLGLDDAPVGLSIWEGSAFFNDVSDWEHPNTDYEAVFTGKFRRLTSDELIKVANGEPLWPILSDEQNEELANV